MLFLMIAICSRVAWRVSGLAIRPWEDRDCQLRRLTSRFETYLQRNIRIVNWN